MEAQRQEAMVAGRHKSPTLEETPRHRGPSPVLSSDGGGGGGVVTDRPVRVVIVHGQRLFLEALHSILSREESVEIVGEAAHGLPAIAVIENLRPDVALLDIGIPGTDGAELIRTIKRKSPDTKPLILAGTADEEVILTALKAGASGYLSKDASTSDLRKAIQGVHQGDAWVERKLIARLLGGDALAHVEGEDAHDRAKGGLTTREQEILRLLPSGGTNKDIAQSLFISEKTVKTHLGSIFRKLNVTRRLQAVVYAIQQGLR